jgi:hypothetical protein
LCCSSPHAHPRQADRFVCPAALRCAALLCVLLLFVRPPPLRMHALHATPLTAPQCNALHCTPRRAADSAAAGTRTEKSGAERKQKKNKSIHSPTHGPSHTLTTTNRMLTSRRMQCEGVMRLEDDRLAAQRNSQPFSVCSRIGAQWSGP